VIIAEIIEFITKIYYYLQSKIGKDFGGME
jgi:hypothetical protein